MSTNANSIGVFDSGIGGLTVVRALMGRLPYETSSISATPHACPTASISRTIALLQIAQFLLEKDVKLLVIACNTMAAVAQVVRTCHSTGARRDRRRVSARGGKKIGVIGPHHHQQQCLRAQSTNTRPIRASIRRPVPVRTAGEEAGSTTKSPVWPHRDI
jgi:hypothetical protein